MRKFGRKRGKRRAFLKGLLHNLIMAEKIETTEARAKEVKTRFDKIVTLAKKQNLTAFRRLHQVLPKDSARKLYYNLAPAFGGRNSGYTRLLKGFFRKRDGAKLMQVELIKTAK